MGTALHVDQMRLRYCIWLCLVVVVAQVLDGLCILYSCTFQSECSGLLQGEDETSMRHLSLYSLASLQYIMTSVSY